MSKLHQYNTDENYELDSSSNSENEESDIVELASCDKFEEDEPLEKEIITEDELYDSTYDYYIATCVIIYASIFCFSIQVFRSCVYSQSFPLVQIAHAFIMHCTSRIYKLFKIDEVRFCALVISFDS